VIPEGVPTALLVLCSVLALVASRKSPNHRPLAVTLYGLVGATGILYALTIVLRGPVPYTGLLRAAFGLDVALRILWRWSIAACLWWTLGSRRGGWISLGIGGALALACVSAYPWLRQEKLLGTAYPLIHVGSVIACMAAVGQRLVIPRRIPRGADWPALVLAIGLAGQVVAVYWWRDPARFWGAGRAVSTLVYLLVSAFLLTDLGQKRTGRS
jgi:hypothetical protein